MDGEAVSELIFDQGLGLYYPAVTDYYGYYYTGSEPLSEWDSNHQFFGQDPHISAVQTDSLQNVYYFPSYGYVQSPYNPYNPSIPGAVIGTEASFLETHYPATNPPHQLVVSSPAYIPRGIDPNLDSVPNTYLNPLSTTTGVLPAAKTDGETKKLAPNSFQSSSIQSHMIPLPKEAPFASTVPASKQPSVFRVDSQGANQLSNLKVPSVYCSAKGNGYPNYGSELNQWAAGDNKFRPRLQINGTWASNRGGSLPEQNRGPRSDLAKCQWVSPLRVKAYTTRAGAVDAEGNIIISADHFNRDDFSIDFPDAKFFVIKSYSEDDVHKSIKYNVWSSTPSGNKRLDNAYDEAMKLSLGRAQRCPVFFFFSVNASGQFCGVAEMTGPVDFQKDMDFWQQDKWLGSFPVRWHIVKDVSNTVLRHILLENNEYKPVTCSRDTQEIPYVQGIALLHLFKAASLETSILDDFLHYEERQRILFEEKSRISGRRLLINNNISNSSNNAQILSSALVPSSRQADDAAVEKEALGTAAESDGREELLPHSPARDSKVKAAVSSRSAEGEDLGGPPKAGPPTNLVILGRSKEQLDGGDGVNSIMKIASLLIDPKADENPTTHSQNDIITVGSMRIKVGQIVGALPTDDQSGL